MMRKLIVSILFLIIITSCNKDKRRFTVTDFSKVRIDTLVPYEHKTYTGFIVRVKGYVNDTIKIKREGYYDINFSGKVDTLLNSDYYGTYDVICVFDPYKATEGKLKIEYSL